VDQRRDRSGAFHGIREPGVEGKLGRFTHRTAEDAERGDREEGGVLIDEGVGCALRYLKLRTDAVER